ncbi:hypothetical protein [Limnoglobus roseus]|uniref:Uncharacterized protein n=1 Tax=Limnoglobus roseus TaxID=2598579 RepID=A0A5C1AQ50_9BACT|nr:hypothetical protein [Limnoglobus roseus]QEL21130.1 hypothetical protein PX52LOC_08260 [Limnoglobus roseus]
MWHSIKYSLGWLMNDLLPAARGRPGSQAVHVRYESAGLVLHELPIPASADAVIVEVLLRLPNAARHKGDFTLRIPGYEPVPPESLRRDDRDPHRYRLNFRLPVPAFSSRAELLWRNHLLSEVAIPVLNLDEFLSQLKVTNPTVSAQIADRSVTAQTFVASQCRGLTTALVLKSASALVPLSQVGVRVAFRSENTAAEQVVPVALTSSQLNAKEALLTASPPKLPRRAGNYTATWYAGNRELVVLRMQAVTGAKFVQSLRISDTRFVVSDKAGVLRFVRHAPLPDSESIRIGPCFVLNSSQPGMAGWITLKTVGQPGNADAPVQAEQSVLVTDGPTIFAPGLFDLADVAGLNGFELRHKLHTLGVMSLHPVPTAIFNAEGGFKPPPEFSWTPTAEEELAERLAKLMKESG